MMYDAIADWYDAQVRDWNGLLPFHTLAIDTLLELAGDVRNLDVCDLACGQGILSRALARRGARVTGVDLSERLLAIARLDEANEPLGVTYIHDDAQLLAALGDAHFDALTCNLALMDIPDLNATATAIARILRLTGTLVFSITHPCITPPGSWWTTEAEGGPGRHVMGYFSEGYSIPPNSPGVRGRVGTFHRMLATYINAFTRAGFRLDRVAEPQATEASAIRQPGATQAPMFFISRWTRTA